MSVLIIAIVSLILNILTYAPKCNWFSILGFCLAIMAWVMGRKMYRTIGGKNALLSMVLGTISTFLGLLGILISFVIGTLLFGGSLIFA